MGGASSALSDEFVNVEHLVIFVHGVGFNGHRHGLYLKKRIEEQNFDCITKVYLTNSNIGYYKYQTMKNTLGGIESGGERLKEELNILLDPGNLRIITYTR